MTPDDQALLARVPESLREPNGIPSEDHVGRRERAHELVKDALSEVLQPQGIRISPLGPGWSTDVDVHVGRLPAPEILLRRGWLPLDDLLTALGSPGTGRWAVFENGRVLASLDIHLVPPHRPVEGIISRCKRRRQVRAREVLELRTLRRQGHTLPRDAVVTAAANAEAALGGSDLEEWREGAPVSPPVSLASAPLREAGAIVARVRRHRRMVVAVSGVDGSGKSTLVGEVRAQLRDAGVPVASVWTRPGLRLGGLEPFARVAKRLLKQSEEPGIRQVAKGTSRPQLSRTGAIGWAWSVLVTLSFVWGVRKTYARSRGVLLFDRHLLDALATLEFAYGTVNLTLQRWFIRSLLPAAATTFYLDIDADEAISRKKDDVFGEHAVAAQLELYRALLQSNAGVAVLDATDPPERLAEVVIRAIVEG
ncbi:MAG: hypothetical protein M3285_06645 [Actinomycetota bacterium]|nr:hypothetical protein [Actinomycetota bacterium]